MRRRAIWSVGAFILFIALVVEILVLVQRSGILYQPLPDSVERLRREFLEPQMTVEWVRPPVGPVAADSLFAGVAGRQVNEDDGSPLAVADEDVVESFVRALAEQSAEESRSIQALARQAAELREVTPSQRGARPAEVTWLKNAREAVYGHFQAESMRIQRDRAVAPAATELSRIVELRRDAVLDRLDPQFQRLVGVYRNGRARGPVQGRRAAVDRVLANESRRLVARRGITGQDAVVLEFGITNRLQALLGSKTTLSRDEWRQRADVIFLETLRTAARGGSYEQRTVITGRIVVPGWRLRSGESDLTLRVRPDSSIDGDILGVHVRPGDLASARVTGKITGNIDDHGIITGKGTYQVAAEAGDISSVEQGRFTLFGYPTRTGYYLGSLSLKPHTPTQAEPRVLLWEEPGVRGDEEG